MATRPREWVIPPTFSASQLLSATMLNRIEHDMALLFGINYAPPFAWPGVEFQTGGTQPNVETFQYARVRLEHKYNTLHLKLGARPAVSGTTSSTWCTIAQPDGSNASFLAGISGTDPNNWTWLSPSVIDLSPFNLVSGSRYVIRFYIREANTTHVGQVWAHLGFVFESAGSSGFPTLPTISDGQIGAASDMDLWSEALNWLKDRIAQPVQSHTSWAAQTGDTQPDRDRLYTGWIKHARGQKIRFRYAQRTPGDPNVAPLGESEVWAYVNGSLVSNTACDGSHDWKYTTGSYALSGLSDGQMYEVWVEAQNNTPYSSQVEVRVDYFFEDEIQPPPGWSHPRRHSHCQLVESASYQRISDNLQLLHDYRRDENWAVRDSQSPGNIAVIPSQTALEGFYILHRDPWLHYLGPGTLEYLDNSLALDPPDEYETDKGAWGVTNLEEVRWLPYGVVYRVTGASLVAAYESPDSGFAEECP